MRHGRAKCCTKAIGLGRRCSGIEILDSLENTTPTFNKCLRKNLEDLAAQLLCYLHEDQIEAVTEACYDCLLSDEEIEDFAEAMGNISLGPPAISDASPIRSLGSRIVLNPVGPSKRLCSNTRPELTIDVSVQKEKKLESTGCCGSPNFKAVETVDRLQ